MEAKAKRREEKQAVAAQKLALKKEKEARETALKRVEEERRIRAQREKELEEKWRLLQHQISSENELIHKNEDMWRASELLLENNCNQITEKYATKVSPLDVEEECRIITNGVTKISLIQSCTEDCQKYILWFINAKGQRISNARLLEQKSIGETTTLQFELKSQSGFSSVENYFLCVLSFEDGRILGVIPYKIKISFANDFDF